MTSWEPSYGLERTLVGAVAHACGNHQIVLEGRTDDRGGVACALILGRTCIQSEDDIDRLPGLEFETAQFAKMKGHRAFGDLFACFECGGESGHEGIPFIGDALFVALATYVDAASDQFIPIAAFGGVAAQEPAAGARALKRMHAPGGTREKRVTSICVRLCDGARTKGRRALLAGSVLRHRAAPVELVSPPQPSDPDRNAGSR